MFSCFPENHQNICSCERYCLIASVSILSHICCSTFIIDLLKGHQAHIFNVRFHRLRL